MRNLNLLKNCGQFTVLLCMAAIMIISVPAAYAQSRVSGTVRDTQDNPIAGVSVSVKGASTSVITDANGQYSFSVPANATLSFTHVGYLDQSIPVDNRAILDVTMTESTLEMEEVVVVGYGSIRRTDLTGAVSSVGSESLVRGGNTNVVGAMQGMIPGLSIMRSNGKPGGGYNMVLRGVNSFSSSVGPLIVVDGVEGANLDFLNPEDIERIDVLKDASSLAIFGSRGTNGVVMVTTKKGVKGRVQVNYNGYAGFRSYTNQPDMMSGDEYVQLAREAARATNNNVYREDNAVFTDASELQAVKDHNYYDWVKAISSNAFVTNHNISATGGTDAAVYSFSGGYYFEDGMLNPQEYSRYNLKAAIDLKANDYISFGGSMYFTYNVRDTGNSDLLQDAFRMRPTQHPNSLVTGEEIWKYGSNGLFNPLVTNRNEFNKTKTTNMLGNVYISITPAKGLEVRSVFAPNITSNYIGQYRGQWTKANQGTNKATNSYRSNLYTDWTWDNIATYKFETGKHKLDVTGVFSMFQTQYENLQGGSKDLAYNSLWYNLQGGTVTQLQSHYSQSSLMSYMGRMNYSFKDKYVVTISGRYDGSSKLAAGHQWHFFPSAAVAWRLSEEEFMSGASDWLSNLKLRVSYGETGNNNVAAYSSLGAISGSQYAAFGTNNLIGNLPNNLANPYLSWEKTKETNIGVDFGFFNNRLSGSIDVYNRLSEGLIANRSVPVHLGYSSIRDNIGSVRNQGIELALNTMNIQTRDLVWRTNVSLSYNRNEVMDLGFIEDLGVYSPQLAGMSGDYSNQWFIGKPIDLNWNLKTIGVWQLGEEEEAAKYGQKPGQFRVKDADNSNTITDADRYIDGKRSPDFIGGMTHTVTYKNFDFSIQLSFMTGARQRNAFFISWALENNNMNFNNLRKNYWTPENPSNSMAQPSNMGTYRDQNSTSKSVSHTMQKTDYLKVGYMSLGYTFDNNIAKRLKMQRLRAYTTVQNPFIFSSWSGFDPEQPTAGVGASDMMTCNVLFGLNISF